MRNLGKIKFKKKETKISYDGKRFKDDKTFIKQTIKYFQKWLIEIEKTT